MEASCISSLFYIKPQHSPNWCILARRCISSLFYIKPQHNRSRLETSLSCISSLFYIKPQPLLLISQSATRCISSLFYIKPQLSNILTWTIRSCISSLFYIKPQRWPVTVLRKWVVYLLFSTSNHNLPHLLSDFSALYIFSFLHQTTTPRNICAVRKRLYIFSFLHQTTTYGERGNWTKCCISSLFYIKPQQQSRPGTGVCVVYLLFSTSNHNLVCRRNIGMSVVYLLFSTSNHNF